MKLKCIKANTNLTVGKIYDRTDDCQYNNLRSVVNDAGYNAYYISHFFEEVMNKKVKCLTSKFNLKKGKTYQVKEEIETAYILGKPEPYASENYKYPKEYFEEVVEEEQPMKKHMMICVNSQDYVGLLTLNKEYEIVGEYDDLYVAIADNNVQYSFLKNRFKEAKLEVKKVVCINNTNHTGYITKGKEYEVIGMGDKLAQGNNTFTILNDKGNKATFYSYRFKDVVENIEEQKPMNKKVVCIKIGDKVEITKGKEYEVLKETETQYQIINDVKYACFYNKHLFTVQTEQQNAEVLPVKNVNEMPELRSGYVIEMDGELGLLVRGSDGTLVLMCNKVNGNNSSYLTCINNIDILKKYIKKIYRGITEATPHLGLNNKITENKDVIWEFKKPEVVLTIADIAKKFGVDEDQITIEGYE